MRAPPPPLPSNSMMVPSAQATPAPPSFGRMPGNPAHPTSPYGQAPPLASGAFGAAPGGFGSAPGAGFSMGYPPQQTSQWEEVYDSATVRRIFLFLL